MGKEGIEEVRRTFYKGGKFKVMTMACFLLF
jgi:hypothetical protein